MAMIEYLLEAGLRANIPAIAEPRNDFDDSVEPVETALEHEKFVTTKITKLARVVHELP